jgi:hypothetical protein
MCIIFRFPFFLALILTLQSNGVLASDTARRQITLPRAGAPVVIDGKLEEAEWSSVPEQSGFINKWPKDTGLAPLQSHIKLVYDNEYLYVAAVCSLSGRPVIKALKRDAEIWNSDAFFILLDPQDQRLVGYLFGVNAGGAQTDGIVQGDNMTTEWDARWLSAVQVYDSCFTVEMAIPLNVLGLNPKNRQWGLNFIRSDMHNYCYSNWNQAPLQYYGYNTNYMGQLNWPEVPLSRMSRNVIQPYASSQLLSDAASATSRFQVKAGVDAHMKLGPAMRLDLTLNPDFSQVDVDQQVINLDRFNPLLPEKRTFFLENSDLFSNFGVGNLRPYVSRTVGLREDGTAETIIGGVRLSGNLSPVLRLGLMDVHWRC